MKQETEGVWEIEGAGTQRKRLMFAAGEGHVYIAILGRNGGVQSSMVLDAGRPADEALLDLRNATGESRRRKEAGST